MAFAAVEYCLKERGFDDGGKRGEVGLRRAVGTS